MIEFDVRRTRAGELVVHHDPLFAARASAAPAAGRGDRRARRRPRRRSTSSSRRTATSRTSCRRCAPAPAEAVIVTSFLDAVVEQVGRWLPACARALLLGVGRPRNPVRTRRSELFPIGRARGVRRRLRRAGAPARAARRAAPRRRRRLPDAGLDGQRRRPASPRCWRRPRRGRDHRRCRRARCSCATFDRPVCCKRVNRSGGVHVPSARSECWQPSLLLPAGALAAGKPAASTGGVTNVTFQSARLTGTVNPQRRRHDHLLPVRPDQQVRRADRRRRRSGAGTAGKRSSPTSPGWRRKTAYHYRLVAENARGVVSGADRTFTTKPQPLGLTLAATPNPVPFGGTRRSPAR